MASPLGHVIVGIGAAPTPALWAGAAAAACLPDVDFLPYLWGARYWRVHRQATHSILVLLSFSALCWAGMSDFGPPLDWRAAASWCTALLSHVVLDVLCTGPVIG